MSDFIGIRREDKSYWERRVPLPPLHCRLIMDKVYLYVSKNSILILNSLCSHARGESSLIMSTNK